MITDMEFDKENQDTSKMPIIYDVKYKGCLYDIFITTHSLRISMFQLEKVMGLFPLFIETFN